MEWLWKVKTGNDEAVEDEPHPEAVQQSIEALKPKKKLIAHFEDESPMFGLPCPADLNETKPQTQAAVDVGTSKMKLDHSVSETYEGRTNLYIRNIPEHHQSNEKMKNLLRQYGQITSFLLLTNSKYTTPIAFCNFATHSQANRAMFELQGRWIEPDGSFGECGPWNENQLYVELKEPHRKKTKRPTLAEKSGSRLR
eukprot:GHVT01062675.1.p1 GENE.GHVT01062675.1~~GHVT01062675.1.p1  ORF type:complete len:197 (+),score=20.28 GHVT01062675.1:323-913(+)